MAINDIRLNDADEAILGVLEEGRNVPANIEDRIEYNRHYISQRLRRMAEHGIVTNLGSGLYELADNDNGESTRATTAEPLRDLVGLLDEEEAAAARKRSHEWREGFNREMLGEDEG